ncbi:MAG: thioredoxin family protein [gamma proteobacterium symbiont of Ctena orbiculata]|nr:MAG: thioredoxin family protein [gamma proteobacterium symbiont of Ctena orbiculata]PUB80132.1 MAG: thioredoxin family protein [gamma proteobacterium symbiont of Ctena orbiculata]
MLQELKRLQTEWRFELIEIDIDRYPEIRDSYDTRIPLLEDNQGRCLSEYFLDQASLLSYLQGA